MPYNTYLHSIFSQITHILNFVSYFARKLNKLWAPQSSTEGEQKLDQRSSLPAKYQECMARPPKDMILAREDNPWIIPNFLFMAASFGFFFATSTFFDHPISSPMLLSLSTLCLCLINCVTTIKIRSEKTFKEIIHHTLICYGSFTTYKSGIINIHEYTMPFHLSPTSSGYKHSNCFWETKLTGGDPLPGHFTYFFCSDESHWSSSKLQPNCEMTRDDFQIA